MRIDLSRQGIAWMSVHSLWSNWLIKMSKMRCRERKPAPLQFLGPEPPRRPECCSLDVSRDLQKDFVLLRT